MKKATPHLSFFLIRVCTFLLLLGASKAYAQPANDLCSGAIPITVNGSCINGTNVAATTTPATDGAMGCWLTAPSNTVWFQFTTGATPNTYVISTDNGGSTDTQIKLFTSACTGTLAPGTNCNDDGGTVNTLASVITTSALAPSTTYYIEVDVYSTSTGTFCISVATMPDICSGAITLIPGAACTSATNVGASTTGDGSGTGAASCWTGTSAYSNSVFYNFTATNDSMTVSFGNGSLGADLYAAAYSGTCGSLVQLPSSACVINGNDLNLTGLTVGNTYYVMVDGSSTLTGTFCVSVSSTLPGNNNLIPLINTSACGLNFVQASNRVTSRSTGLSGTGLPSTLAISGIPATCRVIQKAYLFYDVSYTSGAPLTSPSVTVVNPAAASFSYSATLVGRSHQKCWGEMGTASYRTDVTTAITGNGNYVVNTAYPANDVDGITLLIIYRDMNATYEGHLLIDNGIITVNDFAAAVASHTITGVNACAAATGTSFLIAGDFQFATHTNTTTGASTSVPVDNFWNFDQVSTNYTLGQPSIAFSTTSNYVVTMDCFSLIATGAYYQTTTCTACNTPLTVSIAPVQPTCGLNNGSATANASTTIYGPYTYSWSPGGMTTQTVSGLAPGTYTVTISDPSGCKTATTTVTLNPSSAATASVSPASTTVCSGSSTTLTASGGGTYLWNTGATTAAITVSPTSNTTYTVTVTSGTCTASATTTVNVTPAPVATFSYTGSPYCQSGANPSPTFSGGGVAGTFSSTAGLVFVSTSTGQVNLSASTPGTYTVTNTIAATGGCPVVTATATITITAPQVATFSYTGSPYCQSASNPSPTFSGGGVAGIFSSTAGLVFVSTSTGQVNLSASTPGTYTVTNTIAATGGCPAVTETATITITAPQVATFSYTGSPYCQSGANPSPTFSGGGVAGTFSSTAGLVFVSTSTGQVNLLASTPGTYTVTNTIAASGGCPVVTATATITITAPQVATFSYTGSPYCQSGANPSPTFSGGGVAGTFSSTAGLVFVSTSTGQVNLSASIPGTYTVTNTIAASGGCPLVTATATITITAPQVATFSYTGSPYCQSGANPSPTFSGGGVAGTFSSTAGLVFVSTSTGQVNLSASTPGTYTVTNTIAATGGCPAVTAAASITINPVQSAAFSYPSSTFCQSGTNPTPTITGTSGGTFSSSPAGLVFVSSGTGEINLSGSALNTYTITYTTSGPCAASATATVTITTAPAATFSYTGTPYCQNVSNPSPTFSGGGTAGVFSSTAGLVFVSATSGQVDLAASTPGTYTVTNTIAASGGCAAATATATITISPVQNAAFNYSSATFCQTGANPTPTITGVAGGTFTSSPAGLVFISSSTGQINLSGSALNTYIVTYTTPGPCPGTATATVTISSPASAVMNYGGPYCQGAANPSPAFAAGASAGTFSSTAGLVFISTTTGQVDLSASTPGNYVITNTIAASGGCPASTDTANITITAPQTATFSYAASPYCQSGVDPSPTFSGGATAGTFSSTAGLAFVSTSTGQVDLSASTPGTYTVTNTIATAGGCPAATATASITIDAPQAATFSYTGAPYCQGASNPSPTFSGGGVAGTFSSTAGLVFVSTTTGQVDLTSSTAGTYTVTNTIAATGGCPAVTATATITINPLQNASFSYSSSTFCSSGSNPVPTITGTSGGTFTSSPAGLTFVSSSTGEINLAGSSLNTYTITYTTAGPCAASSTATVTITSAPAATFSYTGSPYCQGAANPSPTFSGGGSAGTFSSTAGLVFMSTTTGQIDLTASTPGTYTVTNTIAASGGCAPASATATITINPLQSAAFSYSSSTFCSSGSNPIPTITGTSGGAFTSSPAGLTFVSSSTGEIDLAGSSLNTYTITYTTAGPCAGSATATVTITNSPSAAFSFTGSPYCQGTSNPSPTFSGGGTAGTFSSTTGLVFVSSSAGQVDLAASTPGIYTVTNTIPASGGCPAVTATASITITAPQAASFSYTGTPYCQNGTDPSPVMGSGSTAGTFSSSSGLVINPSTGLVTLASSTPGTYTVTNTIPASGGCPAVTATSSITINPVQNAAFSYPATSFCQSASDPSPTITGTSGGTFSASPAGLVFSSASSGQVDLSASSLNTYTITYTTPGPCSNSSTFTLTINSGPTASASSANVCEGQTLNLSSSGGSTYSWNGPGAFSSASQNPSIANAATVNSGTYTVTVNTGGCTDTAQISVTVYPSPAASAGPDVSITQGSSTTLNANGGTSYSWSPASDLSCTTCASPVASPLQTTTYCVVVSNGSCSDSTCVTVTVEKPCPTNKDLAVPNAFSPNGDGANDFFCMPGWTGCIDKFNIMIYDRWGEKVFESDDPNFCWDGTFRGQTMNPCVLVYYINATVFDGDRIQKKGNISLIQ